MIISFESEGGFAHFPGLSRPVRIDTTELPPEEAKAVEALVERARFFDQPQSLATSAPGAADLRSYTITVEDGDRTHTVTTTDTLEDPALRDLIEHLRARQRTQA